MVVTSILNVWSNSSSPDPVHPTSMHHTSLEAFFLLNRDIIDVLALARDIDLTNKKKLLTEFIVVSSRNYLLQLLPRLSILHFVSPFPSVRFSSFCSSFGVPYLGSQRYLAITA